MTMICVRQVRLVEKTVARNSFSKLIKRIKNENENKKSELTMSYHWCENPDDKANQTG